MMFMIQIFHETRKTFTYNIYIVLYISMYKKIIIRLYYGVSQKTDVYFNYR